MIHDTLERLFAEYLLSGFGDSPARAMSQALRQTGLFGDEADVLHGHLQHGPGWVHTWQRPPWTGRRCLVGPTKPVQATFGDLWFDTVELVPAMLIPNRPQVHEHSIAWLSLHPIYLWQFRAFLHLVRTGRVRQVFPVSDDYLDEERWTGRPSTAFVTDVYHDEALAYAFWFGKFLSTEGELCNAHAYLPNHAFEAVMPRHLKLWDCNYHRDFERQAYGHETLFTIPRDEIPVVQSEDGPAHPQRLTFAEWERRPNIGFSTMMSRRTTIDRSQKSHSDFFDLENNAFHVQGW